MNENFETSDINLACFLVCKGIQTIRLDHQERFATFVFPAEAKIMAERFWNGDDMVSAKLFSNTLRNLKGRLQTYRN